MGALNGGIATILKQENGGYYGYAIVDESAMADKYWVGERCGGWQRRRKWITVVDAG